GAPDEHMSGRGYHANTIHGFLESPAGEAKLSYCLGQYHYGDTANLTQEALPALTIREAADISERLAKQDSTEEAHEQLEKKIIIIQDESHSNEEKLTEMKNNEEKGSEEEKQSAEEKQKPNQSEGIR
ncbi:hypothetical protein HAX54_018792, partial [Datura stramonium]|nr:hypothetical protein [Datura stramonium]